MKNGIVCTVVPQCSAVQTSRVVGPFFFGGYWVVVVCAVACACFMGIWDGMDMKVFFLFLSLYFTDEEKCACVYICLTSLFVSVRMASFNLGSIVFQCLLSLSSFCAADGESVRRLVNVYSERVIQVQLLHLAAER